MTQPTKTLRERVEEFEVTVIMETLLQNNFNKTRTAKCLGIDRTTMYNKIRGLDWSKHIELRNQQKQHTA